MVDVTTGYGTPRGSVAQRSIRATRYWQALAVQSGHSSLMK
jgi:hypothetical protein